MERRLVRSPKRATEISSLGPLARRYSSVGILKNATPRYVHTVQSRRTVSNILTGGPPHKPTPTVNWTASLASSVPHHSVSCTPTAKAASSDGARLAIRMTRRTSLCPSKEIRTQMRLRPRLHDTRSNWLVGSAIMLSATSTPYAHMVSSVNLPCPQHALRKPTCDCRSRSDTSCRGAAAQL